MLFVLRIRLARRVCRALGHRWFVWDEPEHVLGCARCGTRETGVLG